MKVTAHDTAPHAGHYAYGAGGHDLERWVIQSSTIPTALDAANLGLPADARYHSGFRDGNGVQFWMFTAIRPLSPGECRLCTARQNGGKP